MSVLLLGGIYLFSNLVAYFVFLRRCHWFCTERGIFFYHLFSTIALTFIVFASTLDQEWHTCITLSIAMASMHGIYSMSFLELWSLAQGSFSFLVLREVDPVKGCDTEYLTRTLSHIGDLKKSQRLNSLFDLGLLQKAGDMVYLTKLGEFVAIFLRVLRWIPNLRNTG